MSTRGGRTNMRTRAGTAQAKRQTLSERGAQATKNLREAMHLPTHAGDTVILGMALAEAAAEEGKRNPTFAAEVRRRYEELAASRRSSTTKAQLPPLIAIRHDLGYREVNPFAPPDPAWLTQVYGSHQLGRALQEYTLDILKRTADVV